MLLSINVLADIIHLLKIIVLCDMFFAFQRRQLKHNRLYVSVAIVIMSVLSLLIHVFDNDEVETCIYIVTIVLMLCMLYREKVHSVIVVTLWSILALSLIDTMTLVLLDIFTNLCNISGGVFSNLIVSAISFVLVYVVGRIYKKNYTAGMKSIGIIKLIGFTLLMAADFYVVTVIAVMHVEINSRVYRNLYLVAIVFVIIGIFIQLAAVIIFFMQRNAYKDKKQLTEKYLEEQKSHYEYLEEREKETKKFRHDFRSHMELISNLARNHDYDKIDEYLEQMHIKVEKLGNNITVQNGIVDAMLNQYYTKALQCGIRMEVKGRFPIDFEMDVYDICTIFSNILSNAIEAAMETEEKYVSVECRYNDTNIIITVKNSFSREQRNAGALLKTRKGDLDYHGYGLENMMDSVHKYNGISDIETKDNMFILSIVFNNIGK